MLRRPKGANHLQTNRNAPALIRRARFALLCGNDPAKSGLPAGHHVQRLNQRQQQVGIYFMKFVDIVK